MFLHHRGNRHVGRADAVLAKDDRRLAADAHRHDMREYFALPEKVNAREAGLYGIERWGTGFGR